MTTARIVTKTLASALAGTAALWAPVPVQAPRLVVSKPPHAQPASQPASRPVLVRGELDEGLVFRATHRGRHDRAIADAALRWGQSPFVLKGLLQHESRETPGAVNPKSGACGMPQFTKGGLAAVTNLRRRRGLREVFTCARAMDPVAAIDAAAELLQHLDEYCTGAASGVEAALAAYNTGKCRARVPGFVLAVWRKANRLRTMSGLPPMPAPRFWWRERRAPRQPNS